MSQREKKHELARAAFALLTGASPGSTTTWTHLARAYRALDQKEKAREAVDHAITLDPLDEDALELRRSLAEERPRERPGSP